MRLRHWLVSVPVALLGMSLASDASAQIPDVIYTWDHAFGEAAGPNNEVWSLNFGANTLTLDNTTNGTLTVTETGTAGGDWAIIDDWNRIRERLNPENYGGLDLTGLSSLEVDLGHSGSNTVSGQIFAFVTPANNFVSLGQLNVAPGGVQTYSVPLTGLSAAQRATISSFGIQIYDHAADGNLTWQVNEIRSAGTPATQRLIANFDGGSADFDGTITNFEETSVIGHTGAKNNTGLSVNTVDGALQWQEAAGAAGVALEFGNNNDQYEAETWQARPMDLRNYGYAEVRLRIQSQVAGELVPVQYYLQNQGFNYHTAGPDQMVPANAQYHTLRFPLAGVPNLDQVNIHGINFGTHQGAALFRIDYVKYVVPEPASGLLLAAGGLALAMVRRRTGK
jgi:hypothetical protein